MKLNWTYATKAIVSLFGNAAVLSSLNNVTWKEIAAGVATAFLVWLVPNTSKVPPVINATERDELNALRSQKGTI